MGLEYGVIPMKKFKEALILNRGLEAQTAIYLGISRQAVDQRIKRNPELQELLKSLDEETTDKVISKFIEAIDNGESWAILHYLKTKGRSRGYSESLDINVRGSIDTTDLTKVFSVEELREMNERIGNADKSEGNSESIGES